MRKKRRFTPEMLDQFCDDNGISPDMALFYQDSIEDMMMGDPEFDLQGFLYEEISEDMRIGDPEYDLPKDYHKNAIKKLFE